MPGSELGASSQGSQHKLFIWDLESRHQGNLRGSRYAPGEVLENPGKGRQKYTTVLILPLRSPLISQVISSPSFPSPSTAAGHSVKALAHFPQTHSFLPLTLNLKGLTVQGYKATSTPRGTPILLLPKHWPLYIYLKCLLQVDRTAECPLSWK